MLYRLNCSAVLALTSSSQLCWFQWIRLMKAYGTEFFSMHLKTCRTKHTAEGKAASADSFYLFGVHRTVYCAQVKRPVYDKELNYEAGQSASALRQSGVMQASGWHGWRSNRTPSARWIIQPPALIAGGDLYFRNQPAEALVAKLQRMQFGKSSEKLRQKSNGKYRKHRSESAHFRRNGRNTGEQYDPALPSSLRQS